MNDNVFMTLITLRLAISHIEKCEEECKKESELENPDSEYCDMWSDGYLEGLKVAHDCFAYSYNKDAKHRIQLYDKEFERKLKPSRSS